MQIIKKISAYFMAFILVFALAACGTESSGLGSGGKTSVNVFAASSMAETLNEIKVMYEEQHAGVEIVLTLDSSGTLKTQIEEGAPCDLFISAAQKQMEALEDSGLIAPETTINLLMNKCVLAVSEGNPADIQSFEDLGTDNLKLMVLGNGDVPAGQYAEEILTNIGLWDKLNSEAKISFASSVKEVTAQISGAAADCGIIYGTDAAAAKLEVVAEAPEGSCSPVIYPAALIKDAANPDEASAFLEYLKGPECSAVFEAAGFTALN